MSMAATALEMTGAEILSRVQQRLAPHQPAKYALELVPRVTHKEGQWWYVVVRPSLDDIQAADYNARVERIERDLKRLDNLNVILLPVVPDWMEAPN